MAVDHSLLGSVLLCGCHGRASELFLVWGCYTKTAIHVSEQVFV